MINLRARLSHLRLVEQCIEDVAVSCAALGANRIYTNTTGRWLVMMQYVLDCATPGNTVTWQDDLGTAKSGAMPFSATGGLVVPGTELGWFAFGPGRSIDLYLSVAAQVSGHFSLLIL